MFYFLKCSVSTINSDDDIMKKFYTLFVGFLFCFWSVGQVSQFNDPLMSGGKMRGYAKNATSVIVCTDGGLF